MPSTPPNRIKPQPNIPNGVHIHHPDHERSHHRERHRSNNQRHHHNNHRSPNHYPIPPPHTPQPPLKNQDVFPNLKRETNTNSSSNNNRSGKELISAKDLDTLSDKQNQNSWFVTNQHRFDSPESIPVIPLFTHAAAADCNFHKNATAATFMNNNVRNNIASPHCNGVNTINYSKGIPASYHNHHLTMAMQMTGRHNGLGEYEREDLLTMGRIQELRERMGGDRVKMNEKALWKCLGAEFLGSSLLLFLGIGCVLKFQEDDTKPLDFTGVALCWAFTVATLAQALGGVSCDINPAVTLANVVTGKYPIVKALMYILMQCLGALAGTSLLKAVLPETIEGDWGVTKLAVGVTPIQGCIIEIVSTFILVFTVFSVSDENRRDVKGSVPLAVGICVGAIVMCSGPLTGASLNPSRSLGPSIIANHFADHWVYWVGPITGGILAGLVYQNVFRQLRPDEIEALEAEVQLRQREQEAKENGGAPGV